MATVNTYLNFDGNTEEAFNFYKSIFGGEFTALQRFKENPSGCGEMKIPENEQEKIMHVALPIGDGSVLMATDNLESMGRKLNVGNNSYISLDAETEAEARKLFDGLSAEGKIEMPLQQMFWGALWGCFVDKFGVQWMINYDFNKAH